MEYLRVEKGKRAVRGFPLEGKLKKISDRQLQEHRDTLYKGYVNKINEIDDKLSKVEAAGNGTYSDYRELKIEEIFATNGVSLHEGYFENLGGSGGQPTGKIAELIKRDFGSFDNFVKDLKAAGTSARGWVVTAYNFLDGRLHNYVCERHDIGGVWWAWPLLIMDVYEHAYFIDYGVKRADYLQAFADNIDWAAVNRRIDDLKKLPSQLP
jgi:Fe-Mn family superoxide dismutase